VCCYNRLITRNVNILVRNKRRVMWRWDTAAIYLKEEILNWIVKASHVPHKLIKILEELLRELSNPSQQISQPVLFLSMEIMDGRQYWLRRLEKTYLHSTWLFMVGFTRLWVSQCIMWVDKINYGCIYWNVFVEGSWFLLSRVFSPNFTASIEKNPD